MVDTPAAATAPATGDTAPATDTSKTGGAAAPMPTVSTTIAPDTSKTQNTPTDFKASLPEELRADPSLKDIKDVGSLAKSFINAQKLVGMDKNKLLAVPAEDADEKTWNDFYTKMGRPNDPKEYKLPVDEKVFNDTFQRSEQMEEWFKTAAHKNGLTGKQVSGMYSEYIQWAKTMVDSGNQSLEQLRDKGTQELKKEWGAAYDTRLQRAVLPLKKYADEDFVAMLDQTGLGSHPAMARFLDKVAVELGEDKISDASKSTSVMTPGEATAAIAQKYSDTQFMKAYKDKNHPSHQWAVDEMSKLFRYQTAGSR